MSIMLNCNKNKQQVGRKDGGATKGQIHSSYLDFKFPAKYIYRKDEKWSFKIRYVDGPVT